MVIFSPLASKIFESSTVSFSSLGLIQWLARRRPQWLHAVISFLKKILTFARSLKRRKKENEINGITIFFQSGMAYIYVFFVVCQKILAF